MVSLVDLIQVFLRKSKLTYSETCAAVHEWSQEDIYLVSNFHLLTEQAFFEVLSWL